MGYDATNERPYADLSNTLWALEGLRQTEPIEPERRNRKPGGLDWNAAIEFISRCQHLRESNDAEWVSDEPVERGGFVYHPEKSMANSPESADNEDTYLRSYGSMTYAGLLSLIYAEVDRNDPRVQSAVDWIKQHWTLDENPRMGAQGLYYYYHTMSKALNVYGDDEFTLPKGTKVRWRPALIEELVSRQRIDPRTGMGYWQMIITVGGKTIQISLPLIHCLRWRSPFQVTEVVRYEK